MSWGCGSVVSWSEMMCLFKISWSNVMHRGGGVMGSFMVSLSFVMNRGNGMVRCIMVNLSSGFMSLLDHVLLKLSVHRCFVMNFGGMVGSSIFRCIVRRSLMC